MTELSPKTVRVVCLLLGGALLALSALMTWMFLLDPLLQSMDARGWRSVPCQILTSRMRMSTDEEDNTVSYYVEIEYRYQFEGKTFTSDRYDFVHTGNYAKASGTDSTRERIAQLAAGTTSTCFVNPTNPGEAVLDRGLAWGRWFASATFPLGSLLAGTAFLVAFKRMEPSKAVP
jgi:hypothetical protein